MRLIYICVYPWGRIKAARGDVSWRERFALNLPEQRDVWIHAASVGEVKLVRYLIDYLLGQDPNLQIHVTTMTAAGQAMAETEFGGRVTLSYIPVDIPAPTARFLDALRPRVVVMAEAEFWPTLLRETSRRKLRLVLVNGRMSEKSHDRFLRYRGTLTRLLGAYEKFFFKSKTDLERFRSFGVEGERGVTGGDMKFDAPLPERDPERIRAMREAVGAEAGDFLFVVGSTRPPEEEIFASLFKELSRDESGATGAGKGRFRMVLAPRHVNRTDDVRAILDKHEIDYSIFRAPGEGDSAAESSSGEPRKPGAMVLVDRIGVLGELFLAADLGFVGGTMSDTGGHNILEPVWAGTPVVFGPDIRNVGDLAEYILARDFGAQAATAEELRGIIRDFRNGKRRFALKTGAETGESPSALAGDYILQASQSARGD